LLAEWIRSIGRSVVTCVDPGGTPLSDEIRSLLLGDRYDASLACEALLFMASRAELAAKVIEPALHAGNWVVSDRFLLANLVYQGHAGGLDIDRLRKASELSTGGLQPDVTIVLDVPIELARARRGDRPDRVERRDVAYHQRVRDGFLTEARARPNRIVVVDASAEMKQVHSMIRTEVERVLGDRLRT
jgi:dTMP kinase